MNRLLPALIAFLAAGCAAANAVLGAVVAPTLFQLLSDNRPLAGTLFGAILSRWEPVLLAGAITVALGLILTCWRQRGQARWLRIGAAILALATIIATWLMHDATAHAQELRAAADPQESLSDDPAFAAAHDASERWYGILTLLLLVSAATAAGLAMRSVEARPEQASA